MRTHLLGALLAVAALLAGAATASAAPVYGMFTLSTHEMINTYRVQVRTLACAPHGGTGSHPTPDLACAQLAQADGFIDRIPPAPGVCTSEWRPVWLRARGEWRGERRPFRILASNPCEGIRRTGGVLFQFAPVLDAWSPPMAGPRQECEAASAGPGSR